MMILQPEKIMPVMLGGAEMSLLFATKLYMIYAVWMSVIKVLEKSGADKTIAKTLIPVTKRLFKEENQTAYRHLTLNLSANLLGMGGAATPMGIKSIETMTKQKNRIMLVVINSTSIQLIPTTILAMRVGATTDILLPSFLVNVATTAIGIILVKVFVK